MDIRQEADDARRATVKKTGNGAHVTVPSEWMDRDVVVLLLPAVAPNPKTAPQPLP